MSGKTSLADRLRRELLCAVESEPVIEGLRHSGEGLLERARKLLGDKGVGAWVVDVFASYPSCRADFLRLLGQAGLPADTDLRKSLVQDALESPDVEVRDAAIFALESWGDVGLLDLLLQHQEPVAWLADYAKSVADWLAGSPT